METTASGLCRYRNSRIDHHVVGDHGLAFRDDAPGQAVRLGCALLQAERHQLDVIIPEAMPGDRLDLLHVLIDDANPGEGKLSGVDGDAAPLTKQLIAIAYTDDERIDPAEHGVHSVEALDFLLGTLLLRYVLQGAEPSFTQARSDHTRDWFDDFPNVDPRAIGAAQPELDVCPGARFRGFDGSRTKCGAIVRVDDVQPLPRALR